jgi:hypothetical protein
MYKLFLFVNSFLSPVHVAVQASHAVAEIMLDDSQTVEEWALNDRTIILLDGGDCHRMNTIRQIINHCNNKYAYSYFEESSLEEMMTAQAVVLPPKIWHAADMIRHGEDSSDILEGKLGVYYPTDSKDVTVWEYDQHERELVNLLAESSLYLG